MSARWSGSLAAIAFGAGAVIVMQTLGEGWAGAADDAPHLPGADAGTVVWDASAEVAASGDAAHGDAAVTTYDATCQLVGDPREIQALVQQVCAKHCTGAVACLDAFDGKDFCGAVPSPDRVRAGETLTVHVFGNAACDPGTIDLATATVKRQDQTFAKLESADKSKRGQPTLIKSIQVVASDDTTISGIRVTLSKKSADATRILRVLAIGIDHGKYYFDVGAGLAVVPSGIRRVEPLAIPGTSDFVLGDSSDAAVRLALMLNVYPGGRRRGEICSTCRLHGESFMWQLFGFQLGLDMDISDATDYFFGGVTFEPVSGVSFGVGPALVRMKTIPENLRRGDLVTKDFTAPTEYRLRAYFSFTFTTDIVSTVAKTRRTLVGTSWQ
jgi:hypothetical protein